MASPRGRIRAVLPSAEFSNCSETRLSLKFNVAGGKIYCSDSSAALSDVEGASASRHLERPNDTLATRNAELFEGVFVMSMKSLDILTARVTPLS